MAICVWRIELHLASNVFHTNKRLKCTPLCSNTTSISSGDNVRRRRKKQLRNHTSWDKRACVRFVKCFPAYSGDETRVNSNGHHMYVCVCDNATIHWIKSFSGGIERRIRRDFNKSLVRRFSIAHNNNIGIAVIVCVFFFSIGTHITHIYVSVWLALISVHHRCTRVYRANGVIHPARCSIGREFSNRHQIAVSRWTIWNDIFIELLNVSVCVRVCVGRCNCISYRPLPVCQRNFEWFHSVLLFD